MQIILTPEAKNLLDRTARLKFPEKLISDATIKLPNGTFLWDIHPMIAARLALAAFPEESPSDTIIRVLSISTYGLQ